jgi:hypothetical protein
MAPVIRDLMGRRLTRISHKFSTAAADPGMFTALRSLGLLDVLSSTPAGPSVARRLAKRPIHACLRRLAMKPCEKCVLRLFVMMKQKTECSSYPASCILYPESAPFPH